MQPKFRFFDNKADNDAFLAASATVVQKRGESGSQPKELDNTSPGVDTVSELTNPQSNTPPKPQSQNKSTGSTLELPITLPLPALQNCDEKKRNEYESNYRKDVKSENTFHDSEVNRILAMDLLDELLTQTLDVETARHQSVLADLKYKLNHSLATIACS